MFQLIEKAVYFAHIDSYYVLPLIGSIHFLFICLLLKKKKLIYLSLLIIILISLIFPFSKLIPNLGSDAFLELQGFDLQEAFFYVKTLNFFAGWSKKHFLLWFLIVIAYILILYSFFLLTKKNQYINFVKINYLLIACLIIIPTSFNLNQAFKLYNLSIISKKNEAKNINYQLESIKVNQAQNKDLSLILYIGESTSRLNWSLYDYFRSTNKSLEDFHHQNPLIIFDNIHSTHTHTSPAILDTLSTKVNDVDYGKPKIISDSLRYSITDILNKASIDTVLYSNQSKSGSWNASSSLLFKNAKKKIYGAKYNLGNAEFLDKDKLYDHEFLEKFVDEIKENLKKNNFYIFHSYAGHGIYKDNIPKKYHKNIDKFYKSKSNEALFGKNFRFDQKETLENYDSTMNYITDNIVFTLKHISKLNKPIIFIYTSDHGESPLTGTAHDSSRYIWEMSAVPFIIYFNEQARLKYDKLFNDINLRANKKNKELLNNLPSLISEIFNIKVFNKKKDLQLSKISKCIFGEDNCVDDYHVLRGQINSIGAVNFTFPAKDETIKNNSDRATILWNMKGYLSKIGNETKVCSHKTNSVARFIRFNTILDCLEIDIIVGNNSLDVNHSLKSSTSLTLTDFIKIQKKSKNILWLNINNINDKLECNNLLNSLKRIYFKDYKINLFLEFPSKIVNKIDELEECFSNIKLMNFPISYDIPKNLDEVCLKEKELKNSEQISCKYLDELLEKIYYSNFFTDLSFDYKNYNFLKHNKYINKFNLNSRHIPNNKILSLDNNEFRLIIPANDDINFN
jgi:glucan phosphoethanolaminetransferase (alkaline phosphatase superfamily)